jgi:GT2 family glycosyltransferase
VSEATDTVPTSPPLSISVVVCAFTTERLPVLEEALDSLRAQTLQAKQLILVVDHSPELLAEAQRRWPDVEIVANRERQGLSGARNTGVSVASGDVVAFLDDDAVAQPGWLAALLEPYSDPEVIGVGGRTDPGWATSRPHWFPTEFDWVIGCTYTGRNPGAVRNLLGGNASYRRTLFENAGFAQHIGRSSQYRRPLACEDTEFCIRVNQAQPKGVFLYADRAVIVHKVPPAREKFAYFRTRCFAEGVSKGLVTQSVGVDDGLSTERRYSLATLPAGVLRRLRGPLHGDWRAPLSAAAILVGFAYTATGYSISVFRPRFERLLGVTS